MRIAAPLSRPEEVELLAAAGADELYCGVVPREWVERFGTAGVNRRLFSNLADLETLECVVRSAHDLGCTVSLALNAQQYTDEMIGALVELAGRYRELGGDAVIVSDPVAVREIARDVPGLGIHVSSLASCHNAETARFFRDLGAGRIILPRHVTVQEVASLVAAVPELAFEVFILNDGCVYEEGACHSLHLPASLGGAICGDHWELDHRRTDGAALSRRETAALATNDEAYRDWVAHRFGCGGGLSEEGLPFGPCGLCALQELAACGVAAVKVVGRESPTPRKVRSVALVEAVRKQLEHGTAEEEVKRLARAARRRPDLCADGYMCYYPEAR